MRAESGGGEVADAAVVMGVEAALQAALALMASEGVSGVGRPRFSSFCFECRAGLALMASGGVGCVWGGECGGWGGCWWVGAGRMGE